MTCFLGLDLGTSSTKVGLWRDDGTLLAQASTGYPLHRPQPTWAEMNPNDWWQAICSATQAVLAQSGVAPHEIAGVGVDAIGWTLVPVDARGQALCAAPIWLDRRADDQARTLRQLPEADRLVDLVANPLDAAYLTPKLIWLREQQPDVYRAAHRFLDATGYIVHRLTGVFSCDFTQAYGYHCFDIRKERWDERAADVLQIPLEKLPPLHASGDIVGQVSPEAAQATGLAVGTPVIAGCLDAAAGAFGSGVARAGQTADQGGTAFGFSLCTDQVVVEPRLIFSHHVVPGCYLLQGGTVGGGLLGWFRETLGQIEVDAAELLGTSAYDVINREVERAQPGADGLIFLPYMAGERSPIWNSDARGVFFGLSYQTTRGDILRAIMEGCAFAVYHNVKVADARGASISEWIGIGGAARSAVWCQIKADITNRPFVVAKREDGSAGDNTLGLALMVARALGGAEDLADAIDRSLPQRTVYEPDAKRHALYEEMFELYLSLSDKLMPDFTRLAKIQRRSAQA
ncbi:MAG: FGGY-family carbohydrate kinase [Anaerolineae bacterium]|nr:FGGY-family carbohydrate kinase [Anaerolineae bacterium]